MPEDKTGVTEFRENDILRKPKEVNKLKFVDSLRGLAILLVVVLHCANEVLFNSKLSAASFSLMHKIFDQGSKGVQLFFIISAFTLFYSHSKRKNEEGEKYNFFIRRFFRIAPMYYFGIILYLLIEGTKGNMWSGYKPLGLDAILSNILFIHGFNVYWLNSVVPGGWSIADEMMFYCMIPILVKAVRTINGALLYTALCLLLKIILEIYFHRHVPTPNKDLWNDYLFWYLPSQLPVFGFGIGAYYIYRNEFTKNQLLYWIAILPVLFLTQLVTGISFVYINFCFAFVGLFMFLKTFNTKLFVNTIIQFFGKISFSLYILHFEVIYLIRRIFFQLIPVHTSFTYTFFQITLLYVIVITIGGAVSYLTYKTIELPFQKLSQTLISRNYLSKVKSL